MKLVGKKGLSGAIEIVLIISMILGGIITVALPWFIPMFMAPELGGGPQPSGGWGWYEKYLLTLGVSAILSELMLWQARAILHNVNKGLTFTLVNAGRLRKIGVECLFMAAFYFVLLFVGMTKFAVLMVSVVFILLGLILLVFAELFKQATLYKEENDMTI